MKRNRQFTVNPANWRILISLYFQQCLYRQRRIVVTIGQGRWEEDTLWSTRELDTILAQKHVPAWFDYWGFDSDHDWPWWRKQLPHVMGNIMPL